MSELALLLTQFSAQVKALTSVLRSVVGAMRESVGMAAVCLVSILDVYPRSLIRDDAHLYKGVYMLFRILSF